MSYIPRHSRPGEEPSESSLPKIEQPEQVQPEQVQPERGLSESSLPSLPQTLLSNIIPEQAQQKDSPESLEPSDILDKSEATEVLEKSKKPKKKKKQKKGEASLSDALVEGAQSTPTDLIKSASASSSNESLSDEFLLDAILDADLAVREHPELANPLIITGETPDSEADPSLAKIRRRRWPVTIAIILAVILIGGAVTYYVLSTQALERETNRTAAYVLLDEAIALIQESDQVVVSLDSATTTEVTGANLSEREVLLERVPTTRETLATAEEKAREAIELLTSSEDKEFAQHVIDASVNREDMLTSGENIISKDIEAMNSVLLFGQAWELIVNADTEFRATAELSKTGSYSGLRQAIDRNNAILTSLQQASDLLNQAQEAFADADYSSVTDYVARKMESVQLAIAADQAILDGDIDAVNARNAEFDLKDAEVVDAASKIPPEPLSLITNAYETATAEDHALYDSARANAAEADSYIREYVGVETQTGVQ